MHNINIVRDVVEGIQELLQQNKYPIETSVTAFEPHKHVANAVQSNQQKLASQLQQMQIMMQAMQLQYATLPQPTYQDYGGRENYVGKKSLRTRRTWRPTLRKLERWLWRTCIQ